MKRDPHFSVPKLLAEIGPIDRFRSDAQLALRGGVDRSKQAQQRASATGSTAANRQLNAALYRIAITQARYYDPAHEYLGRKRSEGRSRGRTLVV